MQPERGLVLGGIRENFDVLANVGISGQEYAKYGTTFDNQIVIIDKPLDPSTKESIIEVREDVNKVEELIDLLSQAAKLS